MNPHPLLTFLLLHIFLLHSGDPTRVVLWCGIGFCAGIGLFFYGFVFLKRRQLVLNTPQSKIRSASMGLVEVSGQAAGPYTMAAPITTRSCYYYQTRVWEWKQQGRDKQWVKVAAECVYVPFFLDDGTGKVLVDPRGAELDLHCDFHEEFSDSFFSSKDPAPLNVRNFLARHGVETGNKIKVEEFCIKPKNALLILGTLAENPGLAVEPKPIHDIDAADPSSMNRFSMSFAMPPIHFGGDGNDLVEVAYTQRVIQIGEAKFGESSQPSAPTQVIRLSEDGPADPSTMTQQQKIAAALMKAGIANPTAWAAAGLVNTGPANQQVQVTVDPAANVLSPDGNGSGHAASVTPHTTANGFDTHPPVVLKKGANDKTFLISWRSQPEVARSLGWKCTLMIWGGPALALLCLYIILSVEHLM